MAELVDHRIADLVQRVAAVARHAQDGAAEDGDLIREADRVVAALGHRGAAVDAEQLVGALVEDVEVLVRWLLFNHDGHVVEQYREPLRQLAERLLDELLEFAASNADHRSAVIPSEA